MRPSSPLPERNTFALTHQEAEEWYRGRDVYPDSTPSGDEVIVTYQGYPLGLAKSRLTTEKQLSARAGPGWPTVYR
jgi:NOL1/NOP2/fmu family ribosome biogenesis protein